MRLNAWFSLVTHQPDTGKIHLYAKNPYKGTYQLLVNIREGTGIKYLSDSEAFIEYSNGMDDIYRNIEEYNPNRNRKIMIVFDYMILICLVIKSVIQ